MATREPDPGAAVRAQAIKHDFEAMLRRREVKTVDWLVSRVRSGKTDHESILVGAARLAEIHELYSEIDREVAHAIAEVEESMNG